MSRWHVLDLFPLCKASLEVWLTEEALFRNSWSVWGKQQRHTRAPSMTTSLYFGNKQPTQSPAHVLILRQRARIDLNHWKAHGARVALKKNERKKESNLVALSNQNRKLSVKMFNSLHWRQCLIRFATWARVTVSEHPFALRSLTNPSFLRIQWTEKVISGRNSMLPITSKKQTKNSLVSHWERIQININGWFVMFHFLLTVKVVSMRSTSPQITSESQF